MRMRVKMRVRGVPVPVRIWKQKSGLAGEFHPFRPKH